MALEDFLPALASRISEINGIEAVYFPDAAGGVNDLPTKLVVTPCATLIPIEGIQMFGGSFVAAHTIEITIYVCAAYNPSTLGLAIPFIKAMRNKLGAKIKVGLSSVEHNVLSGGKFYEGPRGYTYAEEIFTGVRFMTEVKETDVFTVAA